MIYIPPSEGKPSKNKVNEILIKTRPIVSGTKTFQPNRINWSYLYLGKVALTHIKANR